MRHTPNPRAHSLAVERAHFMRKHLTFSELKLWQALRGSRLGVGFRRQFVIGRYIVDFAAPKVRLAVEVDGGYHEGRALPDARRDRDIVRAGWRVLHLDADLVVHQLPEAVARIREALR